MHITHIGNRLVPKPFHIWIPWFDASKMTWWGTLNYFHRPDFIFRLWSSSWTHMTRYSSSIAVVFHQRWYSASHAANSQTTWAPYSCVENVIDLTWSHGHSTIAHFAICLVPTVLFVIFAVGWGSGQFLSNKMTVSSYGVSATCSTLIHNWVICSFSNLLCRLCASFYPGAVVSTAASGLRL